jgi:hypothetical protein
VDVGVFGEDVGTEMESEALGNEDVVRDFGEIWMDAWVQVSEGVG